MLHNYYSTIPQCPSCGSPFQSNAEIRFKKGDELYECTDDNKNSKHIFSNITLPWKIRFNRVETAYMDWIVRNNPDLTLAVTWPFNMPEIFGLVLSNEYFQSTGKSAMLVTPGGYCSDEVSLKIEDIINRIYMEGEVKDDENDHLEGEGLILNAITDEIIGRIPPDKKYANLFKKVKSPQSIYYETNNLSRGKIQKKLNNDLFPLVPSYNYSIKSLSIHGIVHAKTIKGARKIIQSMYGNECAEEAKISDKMRSRFGKISVYDINDHESFYTHRREPLNYLIESNKIILHEYINVRLLSNYISTFDPHLIIFNEEITPFIQEEEFELLRSLLKGRTVLLIGSFNLNDIKKLQNMLGDQNISTLNSYEFADKLQDLTNLRIIKASNFDFKVINYTTNPKFEFQNSDLQSKLNEILIGARTTLKPLNMLGKNNFGVDDILNSLYEESPETHDSFSKFVRKEFKDTTSNPWALEIAEFIKNDNLDKPENFILVYSDSVLPSILSQMKLKNIKTGSFTTLMRCNCDTVILTKLTKFFNPETVNAKHFVFFSDASFSEIINEFFMYKKYLEFSVPFFYNDKNMPEEASTLMKEIKNIKMEGTEEITEEVFDYNSEINFSDNDNDNSTHRKGYQIKAGERAIFLYDLSGNYIVIPENMDIFILKSNKLILYDASEEDPTSSLRGSYIPLDKNGFYASIKARLTYLLLENAGKRIKIDGMFFNDAYKKSRMWIDELYNLSNLTGSNIAFDLSNNLGLTAKNEYYISTWWRIVENYKGIDIYRTDRPKTVNDMIKIFHYIGVKTNKKGFDTEEARKCYGACLGVQKVRKKLLKNEYPYLRRNLDELVNSIKTDGKAFHVSDVKVNIADRNMYALSIQNGA